LRGSVEKFGQVWPIPVKPHLYDCACRQGNRVS
jgi:hypothetical protein